ncbi:MAG: DNA repair protein RecN, partial [Nitrospirae bacterium]
MLTHLTIRDLAVIPEAEIPFAPGLNAITGETGAGKSLVGRALALAAGGRGGPEWIREGARKLVVEAVFTPEPCAAPLLEELGVPTEEPEWVVRRAVERGGRNRVFVNGVRLTVEQLRSLGAALLQGHGQFEQQELLQPAAQRAWLDRYAGAEGLARRVAAAHGRLEGLRRRQAELTAAAEERASRIAFLEFQRREIQEVAPRPGEEAELEARHARLAHAAEVRQGLAEAAARLAGEGDSLTGGAAAVEALLERIAPHLAAGEELLGLAAEARIALEELSRSVEQAARGVEDDPAALEQVEARLAELHGLHRKYGPSNERVLERLAEIEAELAHLAAAEGESAGLGPEVAAAEAELAEAAAALSGRRRAAAEALAAAVGGRLAELEMAGGRFEVGLTPL